MSKFITGNRTILEALELLKAEGFLDFHTYSEDWIIEFYKDEIHRYIFGYQFDINSQACSAIAQDKVATHLLLKDNNVSSVPHFLLSTVTRPDIQSTQLEDLFKKYSSLVIKPTHGYRGENIKLCKNADEVLEFTSRKLVSSWSASPFVDINREIRIVVSNEEARIVYEKSDPNTKDGLKMFNLNLGAKASFIDLSSIDSKLLDLSKQAINTVGLKIGAVDIVIDNKNNASVLEINSGFALDHFAESSEENREKVISFYKELIKGLF
ncbi:MAG: RimK family alpha-L-glutamate ligase [Candidatus Saccharimonadales bacterium]